MPKPKTFKMDARLGIDIATHPNATLFPDALGYELELEGRGLVKGLPAAVKKLFTNHEDNSLRILREDGERTEYVFKEPHDYPVALEAIGGLFKHLNGDKAEVFESYRTSTHVHINFAMETYRTFYNFVTLAIIFDELFVSRCAEHRIGNNFCLRAKDAQYQIIELIECIQNWGNPFGMQGNNRYSSINFASMGKFCTVEFRALECTTDFKRVKHWIDTLLALKAAARKFQTPVDVISTFSGKGETEFVTRCLGEQASFYMEVPGWEVMVRDGMRLAQDFAFCSDWVEVIPEPKKKIGPDDEAIIKAYKAVGINNPYVNFLNAIAPEPAPPPGHEWVMVHDGMFQADPALQVEADEGNDIIGFMEDPEEEEEF